MRVHAPSGGFMLVQVPSGGYGARDGKLIDGFRVGFLENRDAIFVDGLRAWGSIEV